MDLNAEMKIRILNFELDVHLFRGPVMAVGLLFVANLEAKPKCGLIGCVVDLRRNMVLVVSSKLRIHSMLL